MENNAKSKTVQASTKVDIVSIIRDIFIVSWRAIAFRSEKPKNIACCGQNHFKTPANIKNYRIFLSPRRSLKNMILFSHLFSIRR